PAVLPRRRRSRGRWASVPSSGPRRVLDAAAPRRGTVDGRARRRFVPGAFWLVGDRFHRLTPGRRPVGFVRVLPWRGGPARAGREVLSFRGMSRILVTDAIQLAPLDTPDVTLEDRAGIDRDTLLRIVGDYEAIITRSRTQVDEELLAAAT